MKNINSFSSEQNLEVDNKIYKYFDLKKVAEDHNVNLLEVPISLKIILENLLRNEDGESIKSEMISSVFNSIHKKNNQVPFFDHLIGYVNTPYWSYTILYLNYFSL